MNPKASFGNRFRSKLRCIIPSAVRDCSTYQFRCATFRNWSFTTVFFNINIFIKHLSESTGAPSKDISYKVSS